MDADAIVFDAFGTLFDLEALREPLGDDRFETFVARLVPWTWHVTAGGEFEPLPSIAHMAAGIDVADRLQALPAFPDVRDCLDALAGARLGVLSNGTGDGIRALVRNAGLEAHFEHLLAADQARAYKPSPALYALAPQAFDLPRERVLLVSSNEWDIAGAKRFGLRTAWLARGKQPSWVLGIEADLVVDSLRELT